jgi:hypothetical protein
MLLLLQPLLLPLTLPPFLLLPLPPLSLPLLPPPPFALPPLPLPPLSLLLLVMLLLLLLLLHAAAIVVVAAATIYPRAHPHPLLPLVVLGHAHLCAQLCACLAFVHACSSLFVLVCAHLCSFVLRLCPLIWLSFMLGCACSCLFRAHLSASNTQLVHIIIKKLTIVICTINLDKDI